MSLDIQEGEVISLLGVNGAGKTTLSSLLATLHPCTSGDILFKGKSIYDDLLSYRSKVGLCPQAPNLDSALTVKQNIQFAGRYFLMNKVDLDKRVDELLEQFNLTQFADQPVDTLSGGYQRRLLIARELVHSPDIIILDEPTVALDPHIRQMIWDIIRELKANGKTVILTTHYIEEAELLSDRVCIMDVGKIRLIDSPKNLKDAHSQAKLEEIFVKLTQEETE